MIKKLIASTAVAALALGFAANAQTSANVAPQVKSTTVVPMQVNTATGAVNAVKSGAANQLKNQFQENKTNAVNQLKAQKDAAKETLRIEAKAAQEKLTQAKERVKVELKNLQASSTVLRQEALKVMATQREEFKVRVEALKQDFTAKRVEQKTELKAQLQVVKDEKKKEIVERVDNNLNELNKRMVEKWSKALVDMDGWLARMANKVGEQAAAGKDVTSVNAAIESAKIAIASAKAAVETQTAKTYPIVVSSEESLKSDVAAVRTMLNEDLKSVRDLAQSAHKSIVNVLTEFNKLLNK